MPFLPDQQTLRAIGNLPLLAKTTIDGFLTGMNKSRIKGQEMEFSQYRSYQPGDDLRWLDWKMYARSDRYYIRELETETAISVRFLVDASRSMEHAGNHIMKIDYARYLAACLGYLAQRQGDAIGLYVFNEDGVFSLPLRRDAQHLERFFFQLEQVRPAGRFTKPVAYKNIFAGADQKELLLFISDFYEQDGEIMRLMDTLSASGHEILAFHLLAGNEIEPSFSGYSRLEDLETGEQVSISTSKTGNVYQENFNRYMSRTRSALLSRNIFYQPMQIDEAVDEALRVFLQRRNKTTR